MVMNILVFNTFKKEKGLKKKKACSCVVSGKYSL